jgi:hypothetical protein
MAITAIYRLTNRVIKRTTSDAVPSYDPNLEGAHPETDDFNTDNGPWKYDAAWNKVPATQQEWEDAQKDPEQEKLKAALVEFDAACQAMQAANPQTYGAFYNLFKPFANSLRDAMKQIYKSLQNT